MRVRTLLKLTVAVTVVVAAVVIATSVLYATGAADAGRRLRVSGDLTEATFRRLAAMSEWRQLRTVRAEEQWRSLHRQARELLLEVKREFDTPSRQTMVDKFLADWASEGEYFELLVANRQSGLAGTMDPDRMESIEEQLIGEMTASAQRLTDFSMVLARQSREDAASALRTWAIVPAVLVSLLALYVLAGGALLGVTVIRRLDSLEEGACRLSSGDVTIQPQRR